MNLPSIRLTGPILFMLPVLVVVASFSLLADWEGRRAVDTLTGRIVDQVAARVEQQVNAHLAEAVEVTDLGTLLLADGTLDPEELRSWRATIYPILAAHRSVNSVTFGNPAGDATWMIRYPGELGLEYAIKDAQTGSQIVEYRVSEQGVLGERIGSYGYEPQIRPWYQAALAANAPTWSPIYPWVRGNGGQATLGLAYARPIRASDDHLLGVLDSDIGLIDIGQFLQAARPSDNAAAFLVEANGNLIATSADLPVVSEKDERIAVTSVEYPLLKAVARQVVAEEGSFAAITAAKSMRVEVDGLGYRVEVRPLRNPWELDWRLAVVVPEAEVMAGIDELRRQSWFWGGVIALGTLLLGLVVSGSLVRPVTRLANAVRRIGNGDLDQLVAVGGHREFAQLSDELNRMTEGLKDRLRLRQSLGLAMEIQQKLLPEDSPTIPGLDVAGHSTYCDETGGDYYDFLQLSEAEDHSLIVVLGDVMGHGIAAALLMATARGILRSRAAEPGSLGQLLTHVNQLLVKDTGGERFMTMILLVIDPKGGWIRLASAGHDAPILYDPTSDTFPEPPGSNGLPLGLLAEEQYQEIRLEGLSSGHIFLVGTDGLWETHAPDGQIYGKDRLRDVLRQYHDRPADQIANAVTTDVRQFRGDAHQDDDITFVVIKFCEH